MAQITYPTPLDGQHPLLLFLHGNHGTCQKTQNGNVIDESCDYTDQGSCPAGFEVTPNHLGYAYLAEHLASWGFVVVSVNANRGITCADGPDSDFGLIEARGRLVLRHLQKLAAWAKSGGSDQVLSVDLKGKLDLLSVGLMGHSRGGEGVRAGYNLYLDEDSPWPELIAEPIGFRGILEIAPVDHQADRIYDAPGVPWSVILPLCDGDVSNLQGIRPLDRMLYSRKGADFEPKSAFTVWGANHNFFNTEWITNDSFGCTDHAPIWETEAGPDGQRALALAAVDGFFRSYIPPESKPALARVLNPSFALPTAAAAISRVERTWVESPTENTSLIMEGFDQPDGTNSSGIENDVKNVSVIHNQNVFEHSSLRRAAEVQWQKNATPPSLQINWTPPGEGRDVSAFQVLEFDVARFALATGESTTDPTDFTLRLVDSTGTLSESVKVSKFGAILGPTGHHILETVRIPLAAFKGVDTKKIRSLQFRFDVSPRGNVYLSQIRFARSADMPSDFIFDGPSAPPATPAVARTRRARPPLVGSVVGMTRVDDARVRLVVTTPGGFAPRASMPELVIGDQRFPRGSRPRGGSIAELGFIIPKNKLRALFGKPVTVQIGDQAFVCGPLKPVLPAIERTFR